MEPVSLAILGLVTIVIAWLYQLSAVVGGSSRITPLFVACYAIGVFLLVADELLNKSAISTSGLLNIASLCAVVVMFALLVRRKHS